jgi:hypothetical protein
MEQLIFLPFFVLALLVLILTVWWAIKFRKLYENKTNQNRHMESNDLPGRYMEILDSESPTYNVY